MADYEWIYCVGGSVLLVSLGMLIALMELVSLTLTNYRSITNARKVGLARNTVLIGPNNEGKSNILRALVVGMEVLSGLPMLRGRVRIPAQSYSWERDFPIRLQEKKPNGKSGILLEFSLTSEEVAEFELEISSKLNGTLPIRISLGTSQFVDIKVAKPGRGGKALTKKSEMICRFVASRLSFDYIPAVRTAESARQTIRKLVDRELRVAESDPAYRAALDRVAQLQQPYLDKISESVRATLVRFLPNIRDVSIKIPKPGRSRMTRNMYEIIIDDGTATDLQYKGDGVQSLAALGIMRHVSDSVSKSENFVIALEEPESHLHPAAIHALCEVIEAMGAKHQVILSTHCPLFVNRQHISSNVLVQGGEAKAAKSIEQIREILGVRASDNLQSAELVLLVEGASDKRALLALLPAYSSNLDHAISSGLLALDSLGGCGKLNYHASLVRNSLCSVHVLLDDDAAGHRAYEKAENAGLIKLAETHFANCRGAKESEFENLLNVAIYADQVKAMFGVDLRDKTFKSNKKWSERMSTTFKSQGKKWDKKVASEVKTLVAKAVEAQPLKSLNEKTRSAFDALVTSLEERIAKSGHS